MIAVATMLAAAVGLARYDCRIEIPKFILRDDAQVTIKEIQFPQGIEWRFLLALDRKRGRKSVDATIDWAGDPIQIAGRHKALITGTGAIAFSVSSSGRCMFTDNNCVTLVNIAPQPDDSLKFIVLPAALTSYEGAEMPIPFVVVAEGSCKEVAQ